MRMRRDKGFELARLASRAGVSRASLRDWETGRHVPSVGALERVLAALNADPRTRARLIAETGSSQGRAVLAHTPWGAPVDLGEVLRAMRVRQGTTQAEVARAVGVRQSTLAKWEAGDALPAEESLERALTALRATPEEVEALRTVQWGWVRPLDDPFARIAEIAHAQPIPLRDVLLLGVEAELWPRAMRQPSLDEPLAHAMAVRAQQSLMRGAEGEVAFHVRRAIRLAGGSKVVDRLAPAVYAKNWVRQRSGRDAAGAAVSLGRWVPRMRDPEVRDWLTTAWALALVRSGETATGIRTLKAFVEREAPGAGGRRYYGEDLVEAWLLAGEPGQAEAALQWLGDDAGVVAVAKVAAARGESPPPEFVADLLSGEDRLGRGEAIRIEGLAARVRRGYAPRLT